LKVGTVIDPFFVDTDFSLLTGNARPRVVRRCCASLKNKKANAMSKQPKFRQAGLILFATAVVLILPNLSRLFG
jgi:hypothetical protein